jgi:CcmD family protein
MFRKQTIVRCALALVLLALATTTVLAQEGLPGSSGLGEQSLRAYWHVFIAYTIVIVLIGGWAISIGRRLRGVEDRLTD